MPRRTHTHPPALSTRLVALGAALLVFLLTVLAASPSLHASLHNLDCHGCAVPTGPESDHPDGSCAISLLAQGAETLDFPEQLVSALISLAEGLPPPCRVLPEEPARLHHSSRGPPYLS